jgi:hypothetical protein
MCLEGVPNALMSILSLIAPHHAFNQCTNLILEIVSVFGRNNPLFISGILHESHNLARKMLEKYHLTTWTFTMSKIVEKSSSGDSVFSMCQKQYSQLVKYLINLMNLTHARISKHLTYQKLHTHELAAATAKVIYDARIAHYFCLEAMKQILSKIEIQRKLADSKIEMAKLHQKVDFEADHTLFFDLEQ